VDTDDDDNDDDAIYHHYCAENSQDTPISQLLEYFIEKVIDKICE
jgi:hypothetical protein